jgi:hypothetical protein
LRKITKKKNYFLHPQNFTRYTPIDATVGNIHIILEQEPLKGMGPRGFEPRIFAV